MHVQYLSRVVSSLNYFIFCIPGIIQILLKLPTPHNHFEQELTNVQIPTFFLRTYLFTMPPIQLYFLHVVCNVQLLNPSVLCILTSMLKSWRDVPKYAHAMCINVCTKCALYGVYLGRLSTDLMVCIPHHCTWDYLMKYSLDI